MHTCYYWKCFSKQCTPVFESVFKATPVITEKCKAMYTPVIK